VVAARGLGANGRPASGVFRTVATEMPLLLAARRPQDVATALTSSSKAPPARPPSESQSGRATLAPPVLPPRRRPLRLSATGTRHGRHVACVRLGVAAPSSLARQGVPAAPREFDLASTNGPSDHGSRPSSPRARDPPRRRTQSPPPPQQQLSRPVEHCERSPARRSSAR